MCNKLRNTDIKILSSLHLQTFFDHFYSECDVTSRDWLDLLSILEQVGFSFNLWPLYDCFPGGGVQKHSIYSISCIELEFKCTAATVDRRSRQTRCHQLAITWCVIWSILPLLMTTSWLSKVNCHKITRNQIKYLSRRNWKTATYSYLHYPIASLYYNSDIFNTFV